MSAPTAFTWSGYIAFTVPAVPTGMKAGVRTTPRGMRISPVRARPSVLATAKVKLSGIQSLVIPGEHRETRDLSQGRAPPSRDPGSPLRCGRDDGNSRLASPYE